ncbi:heavy-metal-associated domain-containing protein [Spirochaeta cellobiosiphila]|uniref:heavy-metal-associated domain-containing protein n=1 Tax=Spirochaeta cellobiosiphila TaxID=504483 RepID=UPI000414CA1E|nr:heavy metal-associated domain-containing protein [Spirochaeta cellobiosiphila]
MFFSKKKYDLEVSVKDMSCAHCELHVGQAIEKLKGVKKAEANRKKEKAYVTFENGQSVDPQTVVDAVNATGYKASLI